jgi:phosphoribosylformylglycinamidine synthase subunit PurL
VPDSTDIAADLLKLMASPNLASRRWVWEQYDQSVGANTVQRPGGDAAVVRIHGSRKALAITTDCTPRYCYADPYEGGKQAVAEAYRNLCAVGARPLAITNCLNFGNPQRPEIMAQLVGCIEGMAEACRALDFPVVSGNVSLYNETKLDDGSSLAILPTPAIGGVGLLQDWKTSATIGFPKPGDDIFLVGAERMSHLGQSLWLRELHGRSDGAPPRVNLARERQIGAFIRELIAQGLVSAVHDVSDGGLLVAIAEMALAGRMSATVVVEQGASSTEFLFAEDQGCYVVTLAGDQIDFIARARNAGVPINRVGTTLDAEDLLMHLMVLCGEDDDILIEMADLRAAHESFFPNLMGNELTPDI